VSRLRAVLFDVDGTLLDTLDAWVRAFDAGLAAIRRPSMSGSEAARWIGTPIETIYKERCGLAGDDLAKAVRVFQQVEAESVHDGMRSYPGIPEALAALRAWKLAAVTNKRHDTTVEALRVTALLPFFALILGGDSVPRKKPFRRHPDRMRRRRRHGERCACRQGGRRPVDRRHMGLRHPDEPGGRGCRPSDRDAGGTAALAPGSRGGAAPVTTSTSQRRGPAGRRPGPTCT